MCNSIVSIFGLIGGGRERATCLAAQGVDDIDLWVARETYGVPFGKPKRLTLREGDAL